MLIQYIGNWSRGQRHGQGKLFGPKGELFMGQFKANKPYCGEGVLAYHNGDTFAGRYENGLKSGAGLYTSSGGAGGGGTTEGEWVLGKLEGDVTITYAVGGTFQGIYENNWMVCGSGVYYFPNGDRYDGVFVSGRKHGPGRYTDVRNGTVYDGEWVDGRREGYGIYTASDGYVYEGEWKDGMKEGRGVLWRDKDLVYEGLWVKNRPIS